MEMYIWNVVIVLSKFVFYIGFAVIAGYTFLSGTFNKDTVKGTSAGELKTRNRILNSLVLSALIANILWFFANTGAMNEEGILGALDSDMLNIMWNSSVGDTALFRLMGITLALLVLLSPDSVTSIKLNKYIKRGLQALSLLMLAYSFTLVGHVSELGLFEKSLLMVHVLVMAWWFGALYPLKLACHSENYQSLHQLMEVFGKQAAFIVSMLLMAGLILAIQLVGSIEALFSSSYGQTLLVKLFLVTSILGIAAKHKLKLVPDLNNNRGRETLSKSIVIEMNVALAILLVTAGLTSVVGPAN